METRMKKFSVELPEEVIDNIYRRSNSRNESVVAFLVNLLVRDEEAEKKEANARLVAKKTDIAIKEMRDKNRKIDDFLRMCEEERQDASAAGFTEEDLNALIKEMRKK